FPIASRRGGANGGYILFRHGSSIQVATSFRSGTVQRLHVSEHGKICAKYPEKAKEVRTGTLQAIHPGAVAFIESTAEGVGGDFHAMSMKSLELAKSCGELTQQDWKFHFFAWWQDPKYRSDVPASGVTMSKDQAEYFDAVELAMDCTITDEQRQWYVLKEATLGDEMKQEFPSTPLEAFLTSGRRVFAPTMTMRAEGDCRPPELVYDMDPVTGKTIKNKELGRIMVTPDGAGVVLGLKVTYDDGSTAERPVTNNRTAREDDKPKVIPISDFIGTGYKRAALSREMLANANSIRTSLGLTTGADVKGYRQAIVKLQADTEKAVGQLRRDTMLSQEEKESAIAAEREAATQQERGLRDVFGLEVPTASAGAELSPSGLTQWVGNDALRREFVQEAGANGKPIAEHAVPAMLDQVYSRWIQLRRDGKTANSLRESPTPTPIAKQDPRAAEKAALNALVDPFRHTPTLKSSPGELVKYENAYYGIQ
ncbi:hypothetical protein ACRZCT_004446, partial [Aeromonas hydrophila]